MIKEHLTNFPSSPFLFVGSGFSKRYLGTLGWEELLKSFSDKIGKPYEFYRSSGNNCFPRIASLLAKDFHQIWWTSDDYKRSRERSKGIAINEESALKIVISEGLRIAKLKEPIGHIEAEELELLKKSNIDGIITTNWDLLLESIFPQYEVYVGQDQIIFRPIHSIGEIYKIHGSCVDPNSIIFTENDFNLFDRKNPYLVAKLLTIFVEHPIIFLGYSLTDPNIQQILKAITVCLKTHQIDQLRDRLFFVLYNPDQPERIERTDLTFDGINVPILKAYVPNYLSLFIDLADTKKKLPLKLLRKIKESIYELVKTNDPKSSLFVADLDETTNIANLEFAVGVGLIHTIREQNYTKIRRHQIAEDVLFENQSYNPKSIICNVLPEILQGTDNVPVHKYLKASFPSWRTDSTGIPEMVIDLINKSPAVFYPSKTQITRAEEKAGLNLSPRQFIEKYSIDNFFYYYGKNIHLPKHLPELREVLKEYFPKTNEFHSLLKTSYYKLLCIWDFHANQ